MAEPNWMDAFEAEAEARETAAARKAQEAHDSRLRHQEWSRYERREEKLVSSLTSPGLDRALDIAGERLTKRRMEDLTVAIGPVLAAQVQQSVEQALRQTRSRGRWDEGIYSERGVVRYVTIELPAISYRIYQDGLTGVWSV